MSKYKTSKNKTAKPVLALKQNFSHLLNFSHLHLQNRGKIMANLKNPKKYFHSWGWNKWVSSSKMKVMMMMSKYENGYDPWATIQVYSES